MQSRMNIRVDISDQYSGVNKHLDLYFYRFLFSVNDDSMIQSIYLRGELGDSLGAFRDSVLGKLTRKEKADSSLDLTRR